VQTLRFLLAVIAGLRAVFVYGEASAMTSEPWALRTAQRFIDALRWTPRTAPERTVGEPARL
jgi:hypothetical protein